MKNNTLLLPLLALFTMVTLAECSKSSNDEHNVITPTNYSVASAWLRAESNPTKPADLFYVYPTIFSGDSGFMDINDATSRMIAAIAYQMQGSAFDSVCNVYAPHYRQSSASVLKKDLATQAEALKSYPLTDVIAAFEYFITHHNNGRPFILAGHSQGSNVLMYFLSDYMVKHPELQQRMVAAYLIGYDITPTFLAANPHLVFADTSYDTGVIISYNTEAPVIDGPNPVMTPGVGVCINPLTWTRGETNAPASCNLGAYIRMANGTFVRQPGFADAQVNKERGTLFCTTVDPNDYPPSGAFPKGTYHGMDYQFYYFNLRANAVERVKAYLDK